MSLFQNKGNTSIITVFATSGGIGSRGKFCYEIVMNIYYPQHIKFGQPDTVYDKCKK